MSNNRHGAAHAGKLAEMRRMLAAAIASVALIALCLIGAGAVSPAYAQEASGVSASTASADEPAVLAFDEVDQDASCALRPTYRTAEGEPLAGLRVRLWRVADMKAGYPRVGAFANLDVAWADGTGSASWDVVALALGSEAINRNIEPLREGTTDASGQVSFEGLAVGIYLVYADPVDVGDKSYTFSPTIEALPSVVGGKIAYGIEPLMSKMTVEPVSDKEQGTVDYEILKRWDDEGYESARPQSISVAISLDGNAYQTVELSSANGWRYAWEYEEGHVFTVSETGAGSGYSYTLSQKGDADEGYTFTLTNGYTPPDTPKPNPPTPQTPPGGNVPRTGDTWWPVAPLACAGMAMVAAALAMRGRRKADEGK